MKWSFSVDDPHSAQILRIEWMSARIQQFDWVGRSLISFVVLTFLYHRPQLFCGHNVDENGNSGKRSFVMQMRARSSEVSNSNSYHKSLKIAFEPSRLNRIMIVAAVLRLSLGEVPQKIKLTWVCGKWSRCTRNNLQAGMEFDIETKCALCWALEPAVIVNLSGDILITHKTMLQSLELTRGLSSKRLNGTILEIQS